MDTSRSLWTVSVRQPGRLADRVPSDVRYGIEAMKVVGDLDGTDLLLLRGMAGRDPHGEETSGRLRFLDLSEARLRAGGMAFYGEVLLRQERDDKLGDYTFYGCGALETLYLPDSCLEVGDSACCSCGRLSVLRLGTRVERLGDDAFGNCRRLSSVEFPASLVAVGDYAFSRCVSLSVVSLPGCVSEIGCGAFYAVSADMYVGAERPPRLLCPKGEPGTFEGVRSIHVPAGCAARYRLAEGWSVYAGIITGER